MTIQTSSIAARVARRAALLAALTAALGAHAISAKAQDAELTSVQVRYGDLNLSTRDGVKVLRRRIHWAAQQVCGGREIREVELIQRFNACVASATNRALEKVQVSLAQVQPEVK